MARGAGRMLPGEAPTPPMQTLVQAPDPGSPATLDEVLDALKKQGLKARHDAKDWGDWIHLADRETVIAIESMRGLTTSATIEHAADGPDDRPILEAFHALGWRGIDEDGEFALA